MDTAPVQLGPFQLERPIARGAMGVVWRGTHRDGTPVAVKVITVEQARDPRFANLFRGEVRAIASLDHPGVVSVLDFGQVTEAVEAASGGRLTAASPYLVMEFIDGFDLEGYGGKLQWAALRHVLLGLLDALAHAHARGVVHRDLKPANVLISGPRRVVKLTDFGVAHALEVDGLGLPSIAVQSEEGLVGTPNYMAPEQCEQRWRDYGPWTDLYGLGCLAYTLASGRAPFARSTPWATLEAHCSDPVPELEHSQPMPVGLDAWIRRMLAKRPRDRFRRAADAAWALLHMDETMLPPTRTEPMASSPTLPGMESAEELKSSATLTLRVMEDEVSEIGAFWTSSAELNPGQDDRAMAVVVPPLPSKWRRNAGPAANVRLAGVGLNLFGMRSIPLVDREAERDALWSSLRQVRDASGVRIMILRGRSGCGKSRLAEWLCQRAHEVGGGTVMRATSAPVSGPAHGLGPMLARFLRTEGLSRDETGERIAQLLTTWGAPDVATHRALTDLVAPPGGGGAGDANFRRQKPEQRYAILAKLLRILGTERPAVLLVEDAQWALDALGFVEYLVRTQEQYRAPVLVVLTTTEELLRARPSEKAKLEQLRHWSETYELVMTSLNAADGATLLRDELGLTPDLVRSLEPRVRGNPMFAVQLVGHWAQRGDLVPCEEGFKLRTGEIQLPANLDALWTAMIDGVLDGRPDHDRVTLEAAAVLGQAGVASELAAVCEAMKIVPSDDLIDALMAAGLARGTDSGAGRGWTFAHRSLVDPLVASAHRAGRLKQLHGVCAETLAETPTDGAAERVGRHLMAAGTLNEAVAALRVASEEHLQAGRLEHAKTMVRERERALERLAVPRTDQRWGQGWAVAIRAEFLGGDVAEAANAAAEFEQTARTCGWRELLPAAVGALGEVLHRMGDYDACEARLLEAIELALEVGDTRTLARARRELGKTSASRGELDRAVELARLARQDYTELGSDIGVGRTLLLESFVTKAREDWPATDQLLRGALALYDQIGYQPGMADCHNQLGEVARLDGRLEEAESSYRDALALINAVGSGETIIFEINLALTLVAQERYAEARPQLLRALTLTRREKRRHLQGFLRAVLLTTDAAAGKWSAWNRAVPSIETALQETGYVDIDLARSLRQAGHLAARAGKLDQARWAYEWAHTQFEALSLHSDARGIRYTLDRLPPPG